MEKELTLCAVRILPECDERLRKVLKDEWYYLNNRLKMEKDDQSGECRGIMTPLNQALKGFYGKNISISAIVGANGSGKSALLELIYRIINNLSSVLTKNIQRDASESLYYVEGLYAELHYIVDGEWAYISCRGDEIRLKVTNNEELRFDSKKEMPLNDKKKCDPIKIAKLGLFFSIVTNYSVQSFISEDFKNEKSHSLTDDEELKGNEETRSWLDGLFHKNDGYTVPIVLNPYRKNGTIDMVREHNLSLYRLASCFIYARNTNYKFFPKYALANINYKYDRDVISRKIANGWEIKKEERGKLWDFRPYGEGSQTYAKVILESYGYTAESLDWEDEIQRMAALYLVHKTLRVAKLYPGYDKFKKVAGVDSFLDKCSAENKDDFDKMVRFIKGKKYHETLKIRQTIHFLEYCRTRGTDKKVNLNDEFGYDEYINAVNGDLNSDDIREIQEFMPPAIFSFGIMLRHNGESVLNAGTGQIPIGRLSSGERQYLYTFSTYVYHILNILSVSSNDRVHYDRINLVLDEAEICFHPEYQRRFINELLGCLTRLKMNEKAAINIIIATHSPLILSDIVKTNILYLEDGKMRENYAGLINPFCANISDILKQSFFLGMFAGEFASGKIQSLIGEIKGIGDIDDNQKQNEKWDSIEGIINAVGDPFIKEQLWALYCDKRYAGKKQKEIKWLEDRLNKLKNYKHYETNKNK